MKPLGKRLGRRGATLLTLAIIDFIYGWFFIDPQIHGMLQVAPLYRGLRDFASLYFWAGAWWLTGLLCLIFAFRQKDAPGFVAAIIMKIAWVAGLASAWIIWDVKYAWAQAALWATLCGWVTITAGWPEPPPPLKLTEGEKHELG